MLRILVFLLIVVPALAQLSGPAVPQLQPAKPNWQPLEKFPQIGGRAPELLHRSNIALLAQQVVNELNSVRSEASRSAIPAAAKPGILRLIDSAIASAQQVRTLANRGASREQLQVADNTFDGAMAQMSAQVSRFGVYSAGMIDALGRAQYADQQLHAALHQHGGDNRPDRLLERIRHTANLLESQAESLRDQVRPLDNRDLDRAVRPFSYRAARFDRAAEEAALPVQLQNSFADLHRQWRVASAAIVAAAVPFNIRMQATRVDGTMRTLAELIPAPNGGWDGPVIQPIPPIGFLNRGAFVVGAGSGGGPRVRLFANRDGDATYDFFAYDPAFIGGVRVAVADLTGDGVPDLVTAPGPGLPALIRIFDGRTMRLLSEFLAFDAQWTGGVFVAAADRLRDGRSWLAVSTDAGAGPQVKVFDLAAGREIDSFFAFDQRFLGGCRIALGDINGDGVPDLLAAPGPGAEPRVRVFDGRNRAVIADFLAFDRNYTLGLNIAAADLTKNGRADMLVGSEAGGPAVVRVFDAVRGQRIGEIAPFPAAFRGGIRVAAHDFDGDGIPDVVAAPGRDDTLPALPIRVFSGVNSQPLGEFYPFGRQFRGGAFVASK